MIQRTPGEHQMALRENKVPHSIHIPVVNHRWIAPQDVTRFRAEYQRSGPMVKGIPPREAVERLKRRMATAEK